MFARYDTNRALILTAPRQFGVLLRQKIVRIMDETTPSVELETTGAMHLPQGASTDGEMELVISSLMALAPSLALMFGRNCEVVVHDLRVPESSIVALENGHVSGRALGGPLIGGPINDVALKSLTSKKPRDPKVVSYETITADGRRLRSTTTLYYDAEGKAYAAMCMNLDLGAAIATAKWLSELIEPPAGAEPRETPAGGEAPTIVPPPPAPAPRTQRPRSKPDFTKVLDQMIAEVIAHEPGHPHELDRDARFRIVTELEARGAFLMRGAVVRIAEALNVSKFTIYGYLDEIRNA